MRIEVNLQTGAITEHEDAPVTWVVPAQEEQPKPTIEQLKSQLADIAAKLTALEAK